MQFSDPRKMEILTNLADIYDFEGYTTKCDEQGLRLNGSEMEFAQKVGMVEYAKRKYPTKGAFEAYMLLVSGAEQKTYSNGGCSGCGGGQVK